MSQLQHAAKRPSRATETIAAAQTPADPLLCKHLRGLAFGISIAAHSKDPDLNKIEGDFRALAAKLPERVQAGTTEPRTGLPAGDILSAHLKITAILRKIDACCAENPGEFSTAASTVRHVQETVRGLTYILSRTIPGTDVTATTAVQNELSLPRVQKKKPAA